MAGTQLNVVIPSALLKKIKSAAIKEGLTLAVFVKKALQVAISGKDTPGIEERVSLLEKNFNQLLTQSEGLEKIQSRDKNTVLTKMKKKMIPSYTDEGAYQYGKALEATFHKITSIKNLGQDDSWQQLIKQKPIQKAIKQNPDYLTLCKDIIMGKKELTGKEIELCMVQFSHCPCKKSMEEWNGNRIPELDFALNDAEKITQD